jgi:hypothetical protein
MDSWARRRAKLAKEKRWVDSYVAHPPALTGADLVRGTRYHAVFRHAPGC